LDVAGAYLANRPEFVARYYPLIVARLADPVRRTHAYCNIPSHGLLAHGLT
jgi:hypothetical protein